MSHVCVWCLKNEDVAFVIVSKLQFVVWVASKLDPLFLCRQKSKRFRVEIQSIWNSNLALCKLWNKYLSNFQPQSSNIFKRETTKKLWMYCKSNQHVRIKKNPNKCTEYGEVCKILPSTGVNPITGQQTAQAVKSQYSPINQNKISDRNLWHIVAWDIMIPCISVKSFDTLPRIAEPKNCAAHFL